MTNLCDSSAKVDQPLSDRVSQGVSSVILLDIEQNALHALPPRLIFGAQMREFLPDTDLVGFGLGHRRLVQHVERDIRELVHPVNSTTAMRRSPCV
jgi:hypothetical protein